MAQYFLDAVTEGRLSTCKTLYKQGISLDCMDKCGQPALFLAVCSQDSVARASMVAWMLRSGAGTSYVDPTTKRDLLTTAAFLNCSAETLYQMLHYGRFDIATQDLAGRTALHYAVFHKNAASVRVLCKYACARGEKVHLADGKSWTPSGLAVILGHRAILNILVRFKQLSATQAISAHMDREQLLRDYADCNNKTLENKLIGPNRPTMQRSTLLRPQSAPVYNRPKSSNSRKQSFTSISDSNKLTTTSSYRPLTATLILDSNSSTSSNKRNSRNSCSSRESSSTSSGSAKWTNHSNGDTGTTAYHPTHPNTIPRDKLASTTDFHPSQSNISPSDNLAPTTAHQDQHPPHQDSTYSHLAQLLELKALQLSDTFRSEAKRPATAPVLQHRTSGSISFVAAVHISTLASRKKHRTRSMSTVTRSESRSSLLSSKSDPRHKLQRQASRPVLHRAQSMVTLR